MNFIDKAKNLAGEAITRAKDAAANIDADVIHEQVDKLQERIGNEKVNEQIDNLQERFGGDSITGTVDGPLDAEADPEHPAP
ncbi:hypothetical protein [Corynebacterium guangdongense]|uniref:Antitoxin n=1 Tax=Corynebacterium guangdongense TaxID=1783348 RepID=A0ABU2A0Q4_9CORY|nr:hypothetical protein [Corynebacterium guangdongense]MDR7330765.1 hypothetical protein [Corynebacterium guangdongense]WJZ16780.1 hypothetical protein CGUA_00875 [Corynebacterium guangdongense]